MKTHEIVNQVKMPDELEELALQISHLISFICFRSEGCFKDSQGISTLI